MTTAIEPTSAFTGYVVRNRRGEELGTVTDFVLDAELARVCYVVVSLREGFLGLRHREFALPFGAVELDTENECFVTDLAHDDLREARELRHDDDHEARPPAAYRYNGIDAVRRGVP
ncbi:MAG TPA: PRC-barrel domain-containing protein [Gammaproteobacteria bacterium]